MFDGARARAVPPTRDIVTTGSEAGLRACAMRFTVAGAAQDLHLFPDSPRNFLPRHLRVNSPDYSWPPGQMRPA